MDIFPQERCTFSSEVAMDTSLLAYFKVSVSHHFRNTVRQIFLVFSVQPSREWPVFPQVNERWTFSLRSDGHFPQKYRWTFIS